MGFRSGSVQGSVQGSSRLRFYFELSYVYWTGRYRGSGQGFGIRGSVRDTCSVWTGLRVRPVQVLFPSGLMVFLDVFRGLLVGLAFDVFWL